MSSDTLSPTAPQLRALFDILTHHQTYAEVESFKNAEGIEKYGYPFADPGDGGLVPPESSSPLLQLLLTRLVLPMPGIKDLDLSFWNVKFKGIMKSFADADLSESYDKGALGTRKTLATAACAFHESFTRGMLGGVPRKAHSSSREYKSDPGTAQGLENAWDHIVYEAVYGDLVDELFAHAVKSNDIEGYSEAVRDVIDYAIIHVATVLHKIFVLSPEGQYLLKLLESTHKLIPYSMVCQTLRVGNAATMISGIMKIFLAKVSIGGLTNWMGITQNASDGQNLLQRIIGLVLGWDAGDFKKTADGIRSKKDISKSSYLTAIDAHLSASKDQHNAMREKSIQEQQSIVYTIIKSTEGSAAASALTQQQHSLLLEYYSARLAVEDREKIVKVMCRQSPDHVTSIIRELVAAFEPMIRVLHDKVDLRKIVVNSQKFVDDLLSVNKPKRDKDKKLIPPSIEDYILLLRRNRHWFFEHLHDVAKGCPEIRDDFQTWTKDNILEAFRQKDINSKGAAVDIAGAGSMTESLRSELAKLDRNTQDKVIAALDRYDSYTAGLDEKSSSRLQGILRGLQEKEAAKDCLKLGSMNGPGVYHARWQWLLDETLISPATISGPLRHGKDVKDVKARGKTGALVGKDSWDLSSIPELNGEDMSEPPDVSIVLEALGPQFKEIVAEISRQRPYSRK